MAYLTLTGCLMFLAIAAFSQDGSTDPAAFKLTPAVIIALLVGFYEVISRIIPTTKMWSLIGKIIDVLQYISQFLNRKKSTR